MLCVVSSSGNLSFTQWRGLVVLSVKKAHLTPAVRAIRRTSWLNPPTKGILTVATPRSDSCSFRSGILLHLAPFSMVFSTKCFVWLFCCMASLILSNSFSNSSSLLDTLVALWTRQSMTPDFTDVGWWDVNWTYRLVCVGLRYTWRTTCP